MPIDRLRQVAPRLVRRPRRPRPAPPGRTAPGDTPPAPPRLGRSVRSRSHPRPAARQRGARRGSTPDRTGQQGLGLAIRPQRLVGLPRRLEQPGDRRQAPADLDRRRRAGPRLGRQRLAAPPAPTGAPPGASSVRPTLAVSSASS